MRKGLVHHFIAKEKIYFRFHFISDPPMLSLRSVLTYLWTMKHHHLYLFRYFLHFQCEHYFWCPFYFLNLGNDLYDVCYSRNLSFGGCDESTKLIIFLAPGQHSWIFRWHSQCLRDHLSRFFEAFENVSLLASHLALSLRYKRSYFEVSPKGQAPSLDLL